ncbi:hypothetical protein E2C01_059210 [Portunus trituberculatus]|uniref:Uncharacterized protein n=1 Tax=Portunus trituberculatus TaxID=210409 RepID=A0A5B7H8G2_PORTR|nr:hypothetical protein [Portunus trituberculatus]
MIINCRVLPVDRFGYVTAMVARFGSPMSNPGSTVICGPL